MSCAAVGIGGALAMGGLAAAGGIGGAIIASNGAQNAAQTQAQAATAASQLQYNEFETQQANQAPWQAAGANALSQMQNPSFQQPFTMADFQQDPSYQFDLQQGQQAISRSAAASGGLQSGGTLKAADQYAQGMASNDYEQAYNNYQNQQTNQFNRLASVAGMGQTANGMIGQAGQTMAGQVGNNTMGAANASGAASIASGNAYGGALSSAGSGLSNYMMQGQMLNTLGNMNNPYNSLSVPNYSIPQMGSQFNAPQAGPTLGNFSLN